MTLGSLLADVRDRSQRVVIYRSGDRLEIEAWLADHGVPVESRSLPSGGPDPFVEIRSGDEVRGIIGVEAVETLLEPPIRRLSDRDEAAEGYRTLFDILERTVFSGMSRRTLLAVSREIEDRAFRVGAGTLRVGFQTLSTFRSQSETYRTLCAETDLDIHVYGVEDWSPPAIPGVTYHADGAERVEPYWVLAYDGGPDESQACGLVAEQRSDEYTGFWTNDSTVVREIAAAIDAG